MPVPLFCPNPACANHTAPAPRWRVGYGRYHTAAHGQVQRYRCRACGRTSSDQSHSLHYFAKRRVPLQAVWLSLVSGASLREIARRYHLCCPTVQRAVLRLGRQAMAAHLILLSRLQPRCTIVCDGFRCFLTSQDYPCDITIVVDAEGETLLSMVHSLMRRGGSMRARQRRRVERKRRLWSPAAGSMKGDITLLLSEVWEYLRPPVEGRACIRTDEHPLYRAVIERDAVCGHFAAAGLFTHQRTSSKAARTLENPLFAVNYLERLLRHRLKEHTRETIAFGRSATMQMHRAWIFAFDHNCRREHRVRRPEAGTHAEQGAVDQPTVSELKRGFFHRRIAIGPRPVPESIRRVWMGELPSPPVRWKSGQQAVPIRIPAYAQADLLLSGYQQAA